MDNDNLSTALGDLVGAIEDIMLGGVQGEVIEQAGKALICNWNDHNEDKIDVSTELNNWANRMSNSQVEIRVVRNCAVVKTIEVMEMLEAKLELMNGQPIVLVRPSFGTQSDSWCGDLLLYDTTTYPIKFQVAANGMATIFTSEDIKSTKLLDEDKSPRFIIELKGPKDYV